MILFVDDSPMNQKLIKMTLEMYRYEVLTAAAGREAQEIFKERHSDIKLLIIDYHLPDINGIELYNKLKEIDDAPVALGFTGTVDYDEQEAIKAAGFVDIIPKPVKIADLVERVKKYY